MTMGLHDSLITQSSRDAEISMPTHSSSKGGGGIGQLLNSSLSSASSDSSPTNTSTSRSSTTPSVNALLLRRALRLIHCMQKERGASCAYCSSSVATTQKQNQGISSQQFQIMAAARKDTNVAMRLYEKLSAEISPAKTLHKIRNLIDNNSAKEPGFHRILVMFNSLVSSFVHSNIMPHVKLKTRSSSRVAVRKRSSSATSSMHQRVRSLERVFAPIGISPPTFSFPSSSGSSSLPNPPPPTDLKRIGSSPSLIQLGIRKSPPQIHRKMSSSIPRNSPPGIPRINPPKTSNGFGLKHSSPPLLGLPPMSPASNKQKVVGFDDTTAAATNVVSDSNACDSIINRKEALLSLLGCFVRLKESTGVERATLSSLLSLGLENSHHHKQPMLNDLVLEVENQHGLVQELQDILLLNQDSNIAALVQSSVEYGPEMALLQNKILQDFSLVGWENLNLDTAEFWEMITVYIDRLHALELLIMEEIECCLEHEQQQTECGDGSKSSNAVPKSNPKKQQQKQVTNKKNHDLVSNGSDGVESSMSPDTLAAQLFGNGSSDSICDEIQSMPADKVKELLLAMVSKQQQPQQQSLSNSGGSSTSPSVSAPPSPPSERDGTTHENGTGALIGEGIPLPTTTTEMDAGSSNNKEWEINLYELQFQKRIGRGSAGTTYMATWTGQTVAVKVAAITEMGLHGWKSEVQSLQKLHHPNIIRLLGSVYNESPLTYCLVLEYCNGGDLEAALKHSTPPGFFFQVATGIANGMAYLHSRGVIHRDIKPGNVLLDGDVTQGTFVVKVTDFGVSTTLLQSDDSNTVEPTAETGTYRWMAPEVIRHESYSYLADVYSFALLVWQLLTRESPFAKYSQIEAAGMVALEHARPPFPQGTPLPIQRLISTCWSEEPNRRLPFENVSIALTDLMENVSLEEKTWLDAPKGHPVYNKKKPVDSRSKMIPPRAATSKSKQKGGGASSSQLETPASSSMGKTTERKSLRNIFSKKKGK